MKGMASGFVMGILVMTYIDLNPMGRTRLTGSLMN